MTCKLLSVHPAHTIVHVTSLWRVTHFCRVAREAADWWLKIVTQPNVLAHFFSEWRIHYWWIRLLNILGPHQCNQA